MKILREGKLPPPPPPAWYQTSVYSCDYCGTEFRRELDDTEPVRVHYQPGAGGVAYLTCPLCKTTATSYQHGREAFYRALYANVPTMTW